MAPPPPARRDAAARELAQAPSCDDLDRVGPRAGVAAVRARRRQAARRLRDGARSRRDLRVARRPQGAVGEPPRGRGLLFTADLLGGARAPVGRAHRGALPLLRDGHAARDLRGVVPVPARVRATCCCTTALMGAIDADVRLRPRRRAATTRWLWAGIHGAVHRRPGRRQHRLLAHERGRARAMRRAATSRFRSAFDDAPIGMAIVGLDGVGRSASTRRLCERTGYAEDELVGTALDDARRPPRTATGGLAARPASRSSAASARRRRRSAGRLWQHSLVARRRRRAAPLGLATASTSPSARASSASSTTRRTTTR